MNERWKPVVGWEAYYSVSDQGRVRREPRVSTHVKKTRWGSETLFTRHYPQQILKVNIDTGGYAQVVLQVLTEECRYKKTYAVHRLVLEAFDRPAQSEDHAMHKNDVRSDNRLANLRWGTRQENSQDMAQKGRKRGGGQGRYMKPEDVLTIQSRPLDRREDLAREFNTSKSNISKLRARASKNG